MHKESETLVFIDRTLQRNSLVSLFREPGDGVGDRVVKTSIQGSELVDRKRSVALDRQIGDGLAQIAIVVHDLVNSEAEAQQNLPVSRGAHPHFRQRKNVAPGAT